MNKTAITIDFHVHCFPDDLARRAIPRLAQGAARRPAADGTLAATLAVMRRDGVDWSVVLPVATKPQQQRALNDWAAALQPPFIGFGALHPDAPDLFDELDRIHALGLRGVKLHPDYQGFFVDEERMFKLYERLGRLNMITVFHAGVDITYYQPVHCTPQRLARALPAFSGAPVVAAHWGGELLWFDVEKYLVGTAVYLDTSSGFGRMPVRQAGTIARTHGADKLLFATDMPWTCPGDELFFLGELGLDETDRAAVLGGNARRLLGM